MLYSNKRGKHLQYCGLNVIYKVNEWQTSDLQKWSLLATTINIGSVLPNSACHYFSYQAKNKRSPPVSLGWIPNFLSTFFL